MPDHAESTASADALVDVEEPLLRNSSDDLTGDFAEKEGHGQHRCGNCCNLGTVHSWVTIHPFCLKMDLNGPQLPYTLFRLPGTATVPQLAGSMHVYKAWSKSGVRCVHTLVVHPCRCSWQQTTAALLSLQLGWGLWLFPSSYARLGMRLEGISGLGAQLCDGCIAVHLASVLYARAQRCKLHCLNQCTIDLMRHQRNDQLWLWLCACLLLQGGCLPWL